MNDTSDSGCPTNWLNLEYPSGVLIWEEETNEQLTYAPQPDR